MPRKNSTPEPVEQEATEQQNIVTSESEDHGAELERNQELQADLEDDGSEGDGGTEAAEASQPSWARTLQEAGFESYEDVDDAVSRAVSAIRQRDEQLERLTQQVRYYQDMRNQPGPQTQQTATQQATQQQDDRDLLDQVLDGWEDPRWAEQYIEIDDETGLRHLKDGVDDITREKIIAVDRKLRQWGEILQDPRRFAAAIDGRVERMIQDRLEQGFEKRTTEQREQSAVQEFVNTNADWLYKKDAATGKYLRDPVTGELLYSDRGEEFLGHMEQLKNDGVSSVARQIQYAQMAMGQAQAQAAAAPEQRRDQLQNKIDQQRNQMLGRRNNKPKNQREFNGVSPDSGSAPAGGNTLSFGEETLALMKTGT